MTLLVSLYTSSGIVFAADSAITIYQDNTVARHSKQKKLQRITQVGINEGVAGFFGLAEFNEQPMDQWLRRKIDQWPGSNRLSDLGDYLCAALNDEVPVDVRSTNASGFHLGCFENRNGIAVPVMHCVTNIHGLDTTTGTYSKFGDYNNDENLPRHSDPNVTLEKVPYSQLRETFRQVEARSSFPFWFRNGDLAFSARGWEYIRLAVNDVTQNLGARGFKLPNNLEKWEKLADLLVRANGYLYVMLASDGDPTIEAPYRTVKIPWP